MKNAICQMMNADANVKLLADILDRALAATTGARVNSCPEVRTPGTWDFHVTREWELPPSGKISDVKPNGRPYKSLAMLRIDMPTDSPAMLAWALDAWIPEFDEEGEFVQDVPACFEGRCNLVGPALRGERLWPGYLQLACRDFFEALSATPVFSDAEKAALRDLAERANASHDLIEALLRKPMRTSEGNLNWRFGASGCLVSATTHADVELRTYCGRNGIDIGVTAVSRNASGAGPAEVNDFENDIRQEGPYQMSTMLTQTAQLVEDTLQVALAESEPCVVPALSNY